MIWYLNTKKYLICLHPIHWNWGVVEYEGDPGHLRYMFGVFSVESLDFLP